MKKIISFIFLTIMSLGILCSCSGEQGPIGPQGEQGIQGEKGDTGEQGPAGIDGKDGTSLLTGDGEPSSDLGKVGDSYIDLESWEYYVKSDDGWTLEGNIKGEDADSDYIGTEGLEFYPISDTECAVAVGNAKLLKEIVVPTRYKDYTVTTIYGESTGLGASGGFANCEKLEKITLPDTITTIYDYAFFNCSSLKEIVIPNSVNAIGNYAFSSCEGLKNVLFEEGSKLESIEKNTFSSCSSLINVEIPESVVSVEENAFWSCSSLASIVIPNGVETIGDHAFYNCSSLVNVTIGNGIIAIDDNAFNSCTSLTSVEIPSSVKRIGKGSFRGCSSLESIQIPFIGENADGTGYTCFGYIFSSTNYSSSSNSNVPNSLKEVIITGGEKIGKDAFEYAQRIESITIPNSVVSIESDAFYGCTNLTNITIPSSVTSIGENAFTACYKLVEVLNLSSLNIEKGSEENGSIGYYAKNIFKTLEESNIIEDENGYVYYNENDNYYLISYTGNENTVVLPNDINGHNYEIYDYAFAYNENITNVTIPNSVTIIGEHAFSYCSNLTDVKLSSTLITIQGYVFNNCTSLTNITIPSSVTSIESNAFNHCTSLTSIVIPSTVINVADYAFFGCDHYFEIYCEVESAPSDWGKFWHCSQNYNWLTVYYAGQWEYDANGNPVLLS